MTACTAFPAAATQYVGPLDPSDTGNTAFDAVKSYSEDEGYVYNFHDGDEIISSSASDGFIIGSNVNTDLTITGDISVRGTASADESQQLNGLYVWGGAPRTIIGLCKRMIFR